MTLTALSGVFACALVRKFQWKGNFQRRPGAEPPRCLHYPTARTALIEDHRMKITFSELLPKFTLALALAACSSDPNEPADPTNPWSGKTYLLDTEVRDWSEPRGIGQDVDPFVPTFMLRVDGEEPEVFGVTAGTLDVMGAQDTCTKTRVLDATASPPSAVIGPSEFTIHLEDVDEGIAVHGVIHDLTLTNVLPNGDVISEEGTLEGMMDFRELYHLFTLIENATPESVCSVLFDTYEVPCSACPGDDEPFCLTIKATGIGAVPTDMVIEPVETTDPSCVMLPPE